MRRLLGCVLLLCAFSLTAPAAVLTFEDLFGGGVLPSNYGGLTWSDQWSYYDFVQPPYTAASGVERLYNNDGTPPPRFSFASPTVFNGAYFSGSDTAQFELYLSGNLVATSGAINLSDTPTFLASGYSGMVDEVRVLVSQGSFVMDDVTFDEKTAVPEPTTIGLVGLGLAGLLARRFRR
ncbi:MAG: PEP-CTERM sorting domain-containing protein [Acidobacteria bacterium]|nr:PEP-CTERM sorting domain-containing protein [Acidobacteriota bacterium]